MYNDNVYILAFIDNPGDNSDLPRPFTKINEFLTSDLNCFNTSDFVYHQQFVFLAQMALHKKRTFRFWAFCSMAFLSLIPSTFKAIYIVLHYHFAFRSLYNIHKPVNSLYPNLTVADRSCRRREPVQAGLLHSLGRSIFYPHPPKDGEFYYKRVRQKNQPFGFLCLLRLRSKHYVLP